MALPRRGEGASENRQGDLPTLCRIAARASTAAGPRARCRTRWPRSAACRRRNCRSGTRTRRRRRAATRAAGFHAAVAKTSPRAAPPTRAIHPKRRIMPCVTLTVQRKIGSLVRGQLRAPAPAYVRLRRRRGEACLARVSLASPRARHASPLRSRGARN